jgi:hypothetical protein
VKQSLLSFALSVFECVKRLLVLPKAPIWESGQVGYQGRVVLALGQWSLCRRAIEDYIPRGLIQRLGGVVNGGICKNSRQRLKGKWVKAAWLVKICLVHADPEALFTFAKYAPQTRS